MSGKYQAYPEYKDSGVEWLGVVPSHWEVMQLKRTVDSCVNGLWGAEPNNDGEDTIVIRVADFDRARLSLKEEGYTYRRIEKKDEATRLLKPGDLLLEKSGGGEKTLVGQVVLFDKQFKAVTSNFVAKLTPASGFSSRYLNYVFARQYSENINLPSIKQNTGIQNLDSNSYLVEKFGFPDLLEQEAIANFLDRETAKIDTLIEKQQQLIKLLKEKRQAVISHAVTKGLNPNAPMRDSDVEWLGEVPEHWEVMFIKHLSSVKRGASPRPIDDKKYFDENGEYAWVRIADVSKAGMYLTSTTQRLSDLGSSLSVKLDSGQLFVSIAGTVGKPCLTTSKVCIHDGFVYFPQLSINNKFLYYIFEAGEAYLGLGKMGTQLNLNTETVGGIKIGLPPAEEIEHIIQSIEQSNEKFDDLISKANHSISLMHERRTALISAAVTGKIDVRHHASQPTGDL